MRRMRGPVTMSLELVLIGVGVVVAFIVENFAVYSVGYNHGERDRGHRCAAYED